MANEKEMQAINKKLNLIATVLALELFKDLSSKERIRALNLVGFTSSEIGELLGSVTPTVFIANRQVLESSAFSQKGEEYY